MTIDLDTLEAQANKVVCLALPATLSLEAETVLTLIARVRELEAENKGYMDAHRCNLENMLLAQKEHDATDLRLAKLIEAARELIRHKQTPYAAFDGAVLVDAQKLRSLEQVLNGMVEEKS